MGENARFSVVTGASAGLGEVYAEKLAARGDRLLLAARRASRLEALSAKLRSRYGAVVDLHAGDLSDPET